ncbi:MAG: histidine phosphatase family protein [Pseudomonadota bacterium]|nr:histidine phosphatase family protein [Pseudomonadota bacterium]
MRSALLIRHGQASFGAQDYDRLSLVGEQQARQLGQWLRQTGQYPDLVVTGSMRRHQHTAELCVEAAGVAAPQLTLAQLDELDHVEIVARHRPDFASFDAMHAELAASADPARAFQQLFAAAVARWTGGEHDREYSRSWPAFRERVLRGLQALAAHEARHIWAFTSGGPIAVITHALIGAPAGNPFALSWPLVNTSLTRVALGGNRHSLVSYNGWPHLELAGDPRLVTHR